jgi:hypothetical protein
VVVRYFYIYKLLWNYATELYRKIIQYQNGILLILIVNGDVEEGEGECEKKAD